MKKTKRKRMPISTSLAAAYRSYPAIDSANTLAALNTFLAHRALFEALGNPSMAEAAERAWWQDAVLFAGEAAASAEQARQKIEALTPALDHRIWATAAEGHRALSAMITVALEVERARWGLATPTRH